MPKYELTGEQVESLFDAQVDTHFFRGIAVYRCLGTQGQLKQTTDTLTELYASCEMETFGDAIWIGQCRLDPEKKELDDLYQLIVLRKVDDAEPQRPRAP